MRESENKENKEDVCPVCVAVPLTMVGAGMTGVGSTKDPKKSRKTRNILLGVGLTVTLVSLIIGLYYLRTCKDCR